MTKRTADKAGSTHGPENAEHELKKAYNHFIETGTVFFPAGGRRPVQGIEPEKVRRMYKHAFDSFRRGDRLAAERWARTAKHLSRAYWHEAKIAYLEAHSTDLPFLENAREEYNLHEYSDTTADLLESVAGHVPPGMERMPDDMMHFVSRGREHLQRLEDPEYRHELLRAERIKAAHEYGRVVECLALAHEADLQGSKKAA